MRSRKRDPRSYAETLLGLRVTDHPPALEILETFAERLDHLRISENVERLDDALVKLPRQNREHRLAATGDRHGALRRPSELLGEIQQSFACFGDREFGHHSPLVHVNVQERGQILKGRPLRRTKMVARRNRGACPIGNYASTKR